MLPSAARIFGLGSVDLPYTPSLCRLRQPPDPPETPVCLKMPLIRSSHPTFSSLRILLGRKIYMQAKSEARKKKKKKINKKRKETHTTIPPPRTEPSSGRLVRRSPFQFSLAKTWRDAWVPINGNLFETEERLSNCTPRAALWRRRVS